MHLHVSRSRQSLLLRSSEVKGALGETMRINTRPASALALAITISTAASTAGCSGASPGVRPAGSKASSSAVAATSEAASTTPPATTRQYASIVAQSTDDISERAHDAGLCVFTPRDAICLATFYTLSLQAQTLRITLGGAPDRIGQPPGEIADLVTQTVAAATALQKTARVAGSCARGCGSKFGAAWRDAEDLKRLVDGWAPYM